MSTVTASNGTKELVLNHGNLRVAPGYKSDVVYVESKNADDTWTSKLLFASEVDELISYLVDLRMEQMFPDRT